MVIFINRIKMYNTLILITVVPLIFLIFWVMNDQVYPIFKYTRNLREYNVCFYPKTKNIR